MLLARVCFGAVLACGAKNLGMAFGAGGSSAAVYAEVDDDEEVRGTDALLTGDVPGSVTSIHGAPMFGPGMKQHHVVH